jgi:lambda family phage portal protein
MLDRLIRAVSPSWALRREFDRAKLERLDHLLGERRRRYEGADRGRRTEGWLTIDSSPSSASRGALHVLRARCRDLRRNNAWASSAVEALTTDLIGTGVRPRFEHEKDATLRLVKELWAEWAEQTVCDADGGDTFYGLQAGVAESMIEGGECLVRRRRRRAEDGLPVPLQLQTLEGDFIDTYREVEGGFVSGRRVVQGKAYNGFGQLEGYWLFRAHPGDTFAPGSIESVFVPAGEVRHVYRRERRGQVRGIPFGASVVLRLHDFDAYEDNEQLRLVVATSFSAFVKDIDPDGSFDDSIPAGGRRTAAAQPIDRLEPGTVEYLGPNRDIVFPSLPSNEGFAPYARVQLLAVAKGYGLPYDRLTGDLTGANFASGRLGHLGYWRSLARMRQNVIVPHFCEPALRWWLEQAFVAGLLDDTDLEWEWMPPRREMMDPRTETMAEIAQIRAGLRSHSEVVASYGSDPERTLEQLAADLEHARELDLLLSIDGQAQAEDPGEIRGVNQQGDEQEDAARLDAPIRGGGAAVLRRMEGVRARRRP